MSHKRGLICAATAARHPADLTALIQPVRNKVDVVEIRLDLMAQAEVGNCITSLPDIPLLFTNRPLWEGGKYSGCEKDRTTLLLEAIGADVAYIDIELKAEKQLRNDVILAAKERQTAVIISNHNFTETPTAAILEHTLHQMKDSGADIGKIVTTAHEPADVVRILSLLQLSRSYNFQLSAFCMGEVGRISRLATLYLGGCMSYVAVDDLSATAPGQFTTNQFHSLIHLFESNEH